MYPLIDFHCHLDLYPDFEGMVKLCEEQRIYTLGVTTTPAAWPKNLEVTKNAKFVKPALGYHPQLVKDRPGDLKLWETYLPQAKYIGEVGLDAGTKFYASFDAQVQIFTRITQLCSEQGGKIISVHSVRTAKKVLDIIEANRTHLNNLIVLHWFTGSVAEAKRALELGCYFSVNSQMLENPKSQELLKVIPIARLLTETDGPFTAIDGRPSIPPQIIKCVDKIASLTQSSSEMISKNIFENLATMLRS